MTESWPHIGDAAADFCYLLSRGYPREAALALVGNGYGLPRTGLQLLHRGVFVPGEAAARRASFSLDSRWAAAKLRQGFGAFLSLTAGRPGAPTIY